MFRGRKRKLPSSFVPERCVHHSGSDEDTSSIDQHEARRRRHDRVLRQNELLAEVLAARERIGHEEDRPPCPATAAAVAAANGLLFHSREHEDRNRGGLPMQERNEHQNGSEPDDHREQENVELERNEERDPINYSSEESLHEEETTLMEEDVFENHDFNFRYVSEAMRQEAILEIEEENEGAEQQVHFPASSPHQDAEEEEPVFGPLPPPVMQNQIPDDNSEYSYDAEGKDYETILEDLKKKWMLTELEHNVSQVGTNRF